MGSYISQTDLLLVFCQITRMREQININKEMNSGS